MGSDRHYPEEAPVRTVAVDPFAIDPTPVTNADFAVFVAATRYRTLAERDPAPHLYPGADQASLVPGSIIFEPCPDMRRWGDWWTYRPGAYWREPHGAGSAAGPVHPVVHIAFEDAQAYASWADKSLPTEAEWEYAARGGLDGVDYAWGDEFTPDGIHRANTWQGAFPFENTLADGFARTSPVRHFPPNGFGLWDMIGNVWEWTADPWSARPPCKPCCAPGRAASPTPESYVIKGGSHLCAPNYCRRYRPAARQMQAADSSTSHLGFRCVRRPNRG